MIKEQVILDTGVIVALLNRRDTYHAWAVEQWQQVRPPALTCEAVILSSVITNQCQLRSLMLVW